MPCPGRGIARAAMAAALNEAAEVGATAVRAETHQGQRRGSGCARRSRLPTSPQPRTVKRYTHASSSGHSDPPSPPRTDNGSATGHDRRSRPSRCLRHVALRLPRHLPLKVTEPAPLLVRLVNDRRREEPPLNARSSCEPADRVGPRARRSVSGLTPSDDDRSNSAARTAPLTAAHHRARLAMKSSRVCR